MHYYFQKIGIRRTESHIASPDWLENKGATINPKNEKDNKCFQHAITLALNYKIFEKKIEKIKKSNIDFSSYQKDLEEFEQSNASAATNVFFVLHNSEEIKRAY